MLKDLKVDFFFEDDRGSITQLIHQGYAQVNVITSRKGVARGGHFHKANEEAFYIIQGALVVEVNGTQRQFETGAFFGIGAGDMHSFHFLEDTVLVSMYSCGVENSDGTKDIHTEGCETDESCGT